MVPPICVPTCTLAAAKEPSDWHHVKRVPHSRKVVLLELEPVAAALAGLISVLHGLHNQALSGGVNSLVQEGLWVK